MRFYAAADSESSCSCQEPLVWSPMSYPARIGSPTLAGRLGTYKIPSVVPESAKNVLVLVDIYCKNVPERLTKYGAYLRFYTVDRAKLTRYMKAMVFKPIQAISYDTSENMWFPITEERKIYVNLYAMEYELEEYCNGSLYLLGYK